MRNFFIITIATAALAGCSHDADTTSTTATPASSPTTAAKPTEADNSGRNGTDGHATGPTAQDQGNSKQDVELLASVRKAIVADDSLSVNAKNAKILVNGAVIILRGPVASAEEHDKLGRIATDAGNGHQVDNQTEVAAK